MLTITYTSSDAKLADQIKADLSQSRLKLEHPMLVVLASPEALSDDAVRQAIKQAEKDQTRIAIVKVKPVDIPQGLSELKPLDFSKGYKRDQIITYLHRVDLGAKRLQRSQQLLIALSIGAVIMFGVAIWGIITRQVAFPVERYATEYALELDQIATFVYPTLDYLQPRTTDDALNYASTVENIPTRVLIFALQTATSLSPNMMMTQEGLRAIETNAVGTSAVMTLEAGATATPRP